MDTGNRRNKGGLYTEEQVQRVLTGSGITIESEVDSDYIVFCQFHGNTRTPAAEVDKESGIFFCFSCHKTASLTELVMHVSNRTYFEAERFIRQKESSSSLDAAIAKKLSTPQTFVPFDEILIKRLNLQALASSRAQDYYSYRKISTDSIKKFQLGFSERQDMVTIPVHSPDGTPIGFVGRSIEGKSFKNTPGLPKSKTLFNLNRVKSESSVYIVESSFDVIRLDQVGIPAVATLGANVSGAQIDLLQKYFNGVVVVADNDEAGGNMKNRLIEKMGSRVSVLQIDKKYKDIGDMEDSDIKKLDVSFDNSIAAMLK
jgi:DNA primase